jgi:hypothetical protein
MSDNGTLEKVRTVRLSIETDRMIEARAAQKGRTASELIRETLETEFAGQRQTPGQWLLEVARKPARRPRGSAFVAAYRKRHE